ncbi:MAG: iron-containing alcohol dehydrogenase [Acidimicrobiia bacterium]
MSGRFRLEAARELGRARGVDIELEQVLIGPDALDGLADTVLRLAGPGGVVTLEDATPMKAGDEDLKTAVNDLVASVIPTRRVVLGPEDGSLHVDQPTIDAARTAAEGSGCIVSIGSGSITDVGKEAARRTGAPLVAVQTAASVNGFSDDMAVVLRDGVKRTVPSRSATALVIDTRVLSSAPLALTRSGFAEMMGMFTAPADWRLAGLAGHDTYEAEVVDLFRPQGDELLDSATPIGRGDPDGLLLLAELLTASGLAMTVAGRTAPLSGMEHLISHLLDMSAAADGRAVGLHGSQVGVASLVAACLWKLVLDDIRPDDLAMDPPEPADMADRIRRDFSEIDPGGAMAIECWHDYETKLETWHQSVASRTEMAASWAKTETELRSVAGDPAAMAKALASAGAPMRFSQLDPPIDPDRVRWALASCHLMRDRLTIADLAFFTGRWTEDYVEAVLEDAARLGGGL